MSAELWWDSASPSAALGLLGLLLAWAQQIRSVRGSATLWFVLGAGLLALGVIIAAAARMRKGR